jgi:hypothetical protein
VAARCLCGAPDHGRCHGDGGYQGSSVEKDSDLHIRILPLSDMSVLEDYARFGGAVYGVCPPFEKAPPAHDPFTFWTL